MEENTNFKKVFLITMIISLSISALIGIILFLIGDFGEIEVKILLTTISIGGFSLTALCSSALYDKQRYVIFSVVGIIVAVFGFLIITLIIWGILDNVYSDIYKLVLISIILSTSIAHSSLLLLIKSEKTSVNISRMLTLLFISIVAIMLIMLVLAEFDFDFEFYYRLLGVFAILDVLGTIVTPIMLKVTSMKN